MFHHQGTKNRTADEEGLTESKPQISADERNGQISAAICVYPRARQTAAGKHLRLLARRPPGSAAAKSKI